MIGGEARSTPGAAVSGRISSNHGVVDVTAPDLERFPAYAKAGGLLCRLEEGDAMYVPSLWHHAVHSEAGGDGRNVAVNFFLTSTVSREAADAMHASL